MQSSEAAMKSALPENVLIDVASWTAIPKDVPNIIDGGSMIVKRNRTNCRIKTGTIAVPDKIIEEDMKNVIWNVFW